MGLSSTIEVLGRTITRDYRTITGKRIFRGPRSSIVSELVNTLGCDLGDAWPTDDATVSGIWAISDLKVSQIELQYNYGQTDAEAIVTYSTGAGGASEGGVGEVGETRESFDATTIEIDVGVVEEEDAPRAKYKDLNGKEIKTPNVLVFRPTATYTLTKWYDSSSLPSAPEFYSIVGKVNATNWKGANAEWWLCTGARVRQIETDKWQVDYTFVHSPDPNRNWNQLYMHKGAEADSTSDYIKLYESDSFGII